MTRFPAATSDEHTLYAALELSKNSWLLAIQFPDRDNPSLHPIKGGDADGLIAKLDAARQRLAKDTEPTRPLLTHCGHYWGWAVSRDGVLTVQLDEHAGGAVDVNFSQHRCRYRSSHGASRLMGHFGH
jgi:hypothetical protein